MTVRPRCLGRRSAVHDPRMPRLARHLRPGLPPPPETDLWSAELPIDGPPMLGNDRYGCCVEASICHYLQMADLYLTSHGSGVGSLPAPTESECLAIYSDVTGFQADRPETDQGTVVMGPGGAMQHWIGDGVTCGGRLNRAEAIAVVDHTSIEALRQAVHLFGYVFTGASLSEQDVESDFMWDTHSGAIVGGHEFLLTGYAPGWFSVLTWDGIWRCTEAWVQAAVDEALVVYDAAFLDARGVDAAGVDGASLRSAMSALA